MEIKLITPDVAKELLSKNIKNNRKATDNNVGRYAEMMRKGLWIDLHPQPIIVSNEGELLDGQHRLNAVILSGKTIKCYVFTKDKSIMSTIDDGKKRTAGDACKIADIPNANQYAAMMRLYTNYKNTGELSSRLSKKTISNIELIEEYYRNPQKYNNVVKIADSLYLKGRLLNKSLYGALYLIFNEINEDIAFDFLNQLSNGKDIQNNSMYLLRQKLINENSTNKKTPLPIIIAYIFKTWNYVTKGKELGVLKFNPVTEKFPIIGNKD